MHDPVRDYVHILFMMVNGLNADLYDVDVCFIYL